MTPLRALSALLFAATAFASPNMVGRQSNNTGLQILPKPGPLAIDGDLADWDLSGRIHSFAEWDLRDVKSVQTAALYDAENLYLAFQWRDPSPLISAVNPDFNPGDGWKADAVQMRVHTDRNLWITTWYYTADKVPVLHLSYWKDDKVPKAGQEIVLLRAAGGGTDLGQGAAMAYKKTEDGKGFVQEVRIPWKLLYRTPPKIDPGLTFQMGLEFLWGDEGKSTFPEHRYADNLQPGATSREFFWTAVKAWGDAKLTATGKVTPQVYALDKAKLAGTIPVRFSVPEKAARFTVVLEDAQGKRIRNLLADTPPADYFTGLQEPKWRQVEVLWDGLDDAGKLVPVGAYQVRGLTHGGFDATFDSTFYNPGTPPWYTPDGTGGWGSNHAAPENVARAGDKMILGWEMSEGGHAIIALDANDQKIWGDNRGASQLAADADYVYAISKDSWSAKKTTCLIRFSAKDGSYQPFVLDGKPRTFDLEVSEILGESPEIIALYANDRYLKLVLADRRVVALDKRSASPVKAAADTWLVKGIKPLPTALDASGNSAAYDPGISCVRLFSRAGGVIRTFGKEGGRPARGPFDPQTMNRVSSIAFDAKGRLWAAENSNYPRRFSVWKPDGTLDRDFIGGTGYAAGSTYLHDTDPNLAYCGPIEMKLDRATGQWPVTRVLWHPAEGEPFEIDNSSAAQPQRFRSKAGGVEREFMYVPVYRGWEAIVLLMEMDGQFQPVAAVGNVLNMMPHDGKGELKGEPSGVFAGHDPADGFFWNDLNGNARIEADELAFVPAPVPTKAGKKPALTINTYAGWGARISPDDLVFYTGGVTEFRPTSFAPDGAPRYSPQGMRKLPLAAGGDMVPVPGEKTVLNLSQGSPKSNGVDGIRGFDRETGEVKWTYPNPFHSVHGSHRAPMSTPGLVIGPLKIMGTAKMDGDAGSVFAIRGNMGEDYFFTTDGLFAGALFQDGRRPSETLPKSLADLKGRSLANFSEGGEPFSGWFSRQSDGKTRMATSIGRNCGFIVEVKGLETIQRFQGPAVTVDAALLTKADADNAARSTTAAQPKSYIIRRLAKAPVIDGKPTEWGKINALEVGDADIKLAYDDANLYALFLVDDANPMLNSGKDLSELFKSGDSVDLQLATQKAPVTRKQPVAGDLRVVMAEVAGKPVAMLLRPVDPNAPKEVGKTYSSPVASKHFDRVEPLANARVAIVKEAGKYFVEAALPFASLGLQPEAALEIRGDVGYISSDAGGLINTARTYWSSRQTGLVNDLPGEAELRPSEWGAFQFSD